MIFLLQMIKAVMKVPSFPESKGQRVSLKPDSEGTSSSHEHHTHNTLKAHFISWPAEVLLRFVHNILVEAFFFKAMMNK